MSHGNHSQNQVFYIFVSDFHQESWGIRRCFFQEREMMNSTHWIMMIIFRLSWEISHYLSRPEVDKTSGWGPMGQAFSSGNPCWGHVVCLCKSFSPPARWGLLDFIAVVLLLRLLLLILHLLLLLLPLPLLQLLLHHLCIHSHVHFRIANSSPSSSPTSARRGHCWTSTWDLPSSVSTAGPQPGTFRAQWAPLDLNLGPSELSEHRWTSTWDPPRSVSTAASTWDPPSSVSTAGPQRPDRMPESMPDRTPDRMSERMPEDMPHKVPECLPDRLPEDMPGRMPEDMPDRMPEDMPDKIS